MGNAVPKAASTVIGVLLWTAAAAVAATPEEVNAILKQCDARAASAGADVDAARASATAAARASKIDEWRARHQEYVGAIAKAVSVAEANAVAIMDIKGIPAELDDGAHQALHRHAKSAGDLEELRVLAVVAGRSVENRTGDDQVKRLVLLNYDVCPGCASRHTVTPAASSSTDAPVGALPLPARMPYAHTRKIEVRHDRFKQMTIAELSSFDIPYKARIPNVRKFRLGAVVAWRDDRSEQAAILRFSAVSSDWHFQSRPDLTLLLDGKPLSLGECERDGDVISGDTLLEQMTCTLSLDTLNRVARARVVEGKLFDVEFQFQAQDILALRDLLSRAGP